MLRKNILGWSCMAKIPSGCGFGIKLVSHIRISWPFARCPRPYTNSSSRLLATSHALAWALPFPLFQCSAQSKHKPSRTSHDRTFRRAPQPRHSISSSIASEKSWYRVATEFRACNATDTDVVLKGNKRIAVLHDYGLGGL